MARGTVEPTPIGRALASLALACLAFASLAAAQDSDPTPFNLGRAQDIAARPMALGGSYTAVASDASALYYNPAGLSAVKKHELSLSMERSVLSGMDRAGGFPSRTQRLEDLRIQSLVWLLPVPTVRGGLTFAFGYYRPRTFSDLISYEDSLSSTRGPYTYRAEGALENWRAGFGVDIAPDLTFGLAAGYVDGSEQIRVSDSGQVGYLRNYDGFNLEPSLMFKVSPRLRLGFSVVLWEKFFNLEEVYEEKGVGNSEENFQVRFPFQVKSGIGYQGDEYLLAADLRLNGWSQYRYGSRDASTLDKAGYKDEMILSLGGERFIRPANMVVRGGYTFNTLPETSFDPTYNLHRLSAGVGFLFSGALALDLAYSYSLWGMAGDGLSLDNREHRALMTFAFRY
ncbi:MAG: Long-chain fatty acid transport protein [Fibrobacteres bacterium]|nr:Long-chain fatty acid transport protein [Fibrobacterota bacterium]